ncbi:hypothetical protein FKJ92_28480 [Klebsiella pneumoniae]|nr:hypothetical protein [Klebsiella pneumoniae]MBK3243905.1 hypothetical protein [Klebsiella pneumoniae]
MRDLILQLSKSSIYSTKPLLSSQPRSLSFALILPSGSVTSCINSECLWWRGLNEPSGGVVANKVFCECLGIR